MSTSPSHSHVSPGSKPASKAKPASKSKPTPTKVIKPPASSKKPSSSSKKPMSASKKPSSTSKKPSSSSKKPTSSSTQKATAPKKIKETISKPVVESKLSMEEMITDAIKNDKENVRGGVSRPAIKKYLAFRFEILDTPTNVTRLNKAINRGAEKGIFSLPKGASGKVKLGKLIVESKSSKPSTKTKKPAGKISSVKKTIPSDLVAASKKVAAAKKSPVTKKQAVKKPSTSSTKKTAPVKKPVGKKASSTTKKVKAAGK